MTKLIGVISSTQSNLIGEVETSFDMQVNVQSGSRGKSAYEVWLDEGNEGNKQDFLDSLKGITNYAKIENKPSIEMVELEGNKSFKELGLSEISHAEISNLF